MDAACVKIAGGVPLSLVFNSVNTIVAQGTAFGDVRSSVSRTIAGRCD
jgi:hypothetical protein